jgi:AcrR family transcriptional regulator
MPPHLDLLLEERILKAAQKLWRTRGERGLTLRAVAREAGCTTPTVYKRFRDKQAILNTLAVRIRAELVEYLFGAAALEDVGRRYLEFVEQHPHEYRLLLLSWGDIFRPGVPRPGRAWLMTQFAKRFGGDPEDYALQVYTMILLAHGAGSLLSNPADEESREDLRKNFLAIIDGLIANPHVLRSPMLTAKE